MSASVRSDQSIGGHVGVDLRRPQARVTEQLLDYSQIRPAIDKMGRIGVTERVRMSRHR